MSIIKTHDVIQLKDLNNLEFKLLDVEIRNKRFIYRTDLVEDEYIFLTVFKTWNDKFCGKVYLSHDKHWNIEDRKANIRTGTKSSDEDELQPLIEKLAPLNLERAKTAICTTDNSFFEIYLKSISNRLLALMRNYLNRKLMPSIDGNFVTGSIFGIDYYFLRDTIRHDLKQKFDMLTDYDNMVVTFEETARSLIPLSLTGIIEYLADYLNYNKHKMIEVAERDKNCTYF